MIVINIALIILGILYGVGSVTNFKEWYYRHDYLAIMLSVFTSILLVVAGVLNVVYWLTVLKCYRVDSQANGARWRECLGKWVLETNSPLHIASIV